MCRVYRPLKDNLRVTSFRNRTSAGVRCASKIVIMINATHVLCITCTFLRHGVNHTIDCFDTQIFERWARKRRNVYPEPQTWQFGRKNQRLFWEKSRLETTKTWNEQEKTRGTIKVEVFRSSAYLSHRREAVGGARCIGHNGHVRGVFVMIHAHNEHRCVSRRGRDDHLLRSPWENDQQTAFANSSYQRLALPARDEESRM